MMIKSIKRLNSKIKANRACYNSYFYIVEDPNTSILDQICLQGKQISKALDGGAACHINLAEYATKEGFKKLIQVAVKEGCEYFCFNVKVTCCNQCGYIDKRTLTECSKCGSKDVDYATRIIGYLTKISNWSQGRREEHAKRSYKNA